MTIRQNGKEGICSSEFRLEGKSYCYTFNGKNGLPLITKKSEAREKEYELRKQLRAGIFVRSSSLHNFAKFYKEIFLDYSKSNKSEDATKFDEYCGTILIKEFGLRTFAQITPRGIEKFIETLSTTLTRFGTPFAPVTIRMIYNRLNETCEMAIGEHVAVENPCRRVHKKLLKKYPNWIKRERWLNKYDPQEEELLFTHLSGNITTICRLLLNTGMRPPKEVLLIQKAHVNLTDEPRNYRWKGIDYIIPSRALFVANGKNGTTRMLPLNETAYSILELLCHDVSTGQWLFTNRNGQPPKSFKKGFAKGCERAGIDDLRPYDMRHAFSTRLLERGVHQYVISELMGHKPVSNESRVTPGYAHVSWEVMQRAVESLDHPAPNLSVFRPDAGKMQGKVPEEFRKSAK